MNYADFADDFNLYPMEDEEKESLENMKTWADRWLENVKERKVNQKTLKSYGDAIETFLNFVKQNRVRSITDIGARYINRYLMHYQIELAKKRGDRRLDFLVNESKKDKIGRNDKGFTILPEYENTLMHRLTIIKNFLTYISANNLQQHDYTKIFGELARIRIKEKMTDFVSPDDMEKLLDFLRHWAQGGYKEYNRRYDGYHAMRNSLLLSLCALTGARGEEVVNIRLSDIQPHKNASGKAYYLVSIEEGKGGKKRRVAIETERLDLYIDYFKSRLPSPDHYLSVTKKGSIYGNRPLHVNNLRKFSEKIYGLLGMPYRGLHALRRGYVTRRIMVDGANASIVAKEVGNTVAILEKHYLKYIPDHLL